MLICTPHKQCECIWDKFEGSGAFYSTLYIMMVKSRLVNYKTFFNFGGQFNKDDQFKHQEIVFICEKFACM